MLSANTCAHNPLDTTYSQLDGPGRSARGEAVDLTIAGRGDHPAITADRDADGITRRLRQPVAVQGAAAPGIENQQRHASRTLARAAGHDGVADAAPGQARRRQRADIVASPHFLGVVTGVPDGYETGVWTATRHDQPARCHRWRRLRLELERNRPFRLAVGGVQCPQPLVTSIDVDGGSVA